VPSVVASYLQQTRTFSISGLFYHTWHRIVGRAPAIDEKYDVSFFVFFVTHSNYEGCNNGNAIQNNYGAIA